MSDEEIQVERCAKCGNKVRGGPFFSPLGEPVCESCHDAVAGAALAMMAGGGVGEAVALGHSRDGRPSGILAWIRRSLARRGPDTRT